MAQRQQSRSIGSGLQHSGRRLYRLAWVCVALIPLGLAAGFVTGDGLLALQGYPDATNPPLRVLVTAALPALILLIAPAIAAALFGLRARSRGVPAATVPAVLGLAATGATVLANLLPLLIGR